MNIVDRRPNPKGKSLSNRQRFLGRARAVVNSLASAIEDDKLRQTFLAAKPVRDLSC